MRKILHMLTVATLAFGLIACDNVVLPGGGGTGGGTGGGQNDPGDSTGGGGGNTDSNYVISIGGPIGDQRGQIAAAPEGATLVVLWQTGRGTYYVFGQGTLSQDRTEWSVDLTLPSLPEEALFSFPGEPGVHGIGTPMLVMGQYADGDSYTPSPNGPVGLSYIPGNVDIIYNTGRDATNDISAPWIGNFPVGYSMGRVGFSGWVPTDETTFPMFLRR